jgi:predicted GNAT family N-acyltransferase
MTTGLDRIASDAKLCSVLAEACQFCSSDPGVAVEPRILSKAFRSKRTVDFDLTVSMEPTLIKLIREQRPGSPGVLSEEQLEFDRQLDVSSFHVAALQGDQIVGAMRLVENPRDSLVLREHSAYRIHGLCPELFANGIVEIGRAWVLSSARISGVFLSMIRKAAEHCVERSYRYITLSADERLSALYRRLGCQALVKFAAPGDSALWTLYAYDLGMIKNPSRFLDGDTPQLDAVFE